GLRDKGALRAGVDLLDDRVFPPRVEVSGPADDPPDVRLAVAPLGHEDLRRLPAAGLQRRDVGLLELADQLAVGGAPQLVDRGQVYPAIGVDEEAPIWRILDRVVSVPVGQGDQFGAIEVDAIGVDEIRVLARILAAGAEPDLPLRLVDEVDAPDDIGPLGDLVLDRARPRIDQVEMPPAVALRGVEDFARLIQPVDGVQPHRLPVSGPDERRARLVDDVAILAGMRIDADHSVALVPAVDLLIAEVAAVLAPVQPWGAEIDPIHVRPDGLVAGDIEQVELIRREPVARQRGRPRPPPGPAPAPRPPLGPEDLPAHP